MQLKISFLWFIVIKKNIKFKGFDVGMKVIYHVIF